MLPADGETVEELVSQTLTLSDGGETTVLDLLCVHLERVFGKVETLLNESGELTDPTALLTQDFLGVGSTDDNLANCDLFRSLEGYPTSRSPQYERGSLGHRNQSIPPR